MVKSLFISFDPTADGLQFVPTKDYLAYFNGNVGNLAFVYAMSKQITDTIVYKNGRKLSNKEIRENFDVLVFPAANNISEASDMGWLADIMEDTQLPILIAGLGVQAKLGEVRFPVPQGTKRFIDILRDRKTSVGVRGKFTQEFLAELGLETSVITGCPSNFINPNVNLGRSLDAKYHSIKSDISTVALNLEYFRLESVKVRVLTSWLTHHSGAMVLQSDNEIFSLLRNDYIGTAEKASWMGKYFTGDGDVKSFKIWLDRFARVYCNVPSWMDYLRCLSVSIGSRFHGNMLAIQAGTPAIVLPHDSRTKEMCETMMVPHYSWDRIEPTDNLEMIISKIDFSGLKYDRRRQQLALVYRKLVEDTGLTINETMKRICETPVI